ncbi:GlsB/YeaQ/YmgE family stress response membrane protein [Alcaligenaceae bacterium 429]|jgi:uncharacterized membrane protein YeaQ/YmgE (transglycosylase-associated protein family)|uniref:GlsB/YeaQ/YmgE family stress response membrane protein n=1 Tax=unclassified Paenalcaligenes TaxID=2685726 RepID=UPI001091DD7A|nr:GlsB/YeaQ/YmgE family stress response membrane protein [Alcaligenaceae bacterium 429]
MGFIWMLLVGFIVGLLARAIMPGNQSMGIILTTVLGIIGSLVGGFLGQSLGLYQQGAQVGLIGSVIGAIVVLFIYGLISKKG